MTQRKVNVTAAEEVSGNDFTSSPSSWGFSVGTKATQNWLPRNESSDVLKLGGIYLTSPSNNLTCLRTEGGVTDGSAAVFGRDSR